jgi:ABC-type multidrug transport system fused ATPase/permease subunit
MEPTIYKYLLRYSRKQQIWLTVLAALSFPFLYFFYELPKMIINNAILGSPGDFPRDLGGFGVIEVEHIPYLLVLCVGFLALVVVNQGFKYYINVYRGLTGERMLRRLRYDLFSRVLRFPQPTFKNMSQGEIIPMVTAEVEPLGGFVGEAFSLPAFQGGTLLVILGFLFVQNWMMAVAAVALYPLQLYIIPRLQMKVNLLGKERVKLVRKLSDRIGENVQGVVEIHAHDTAQLELADFSSRLGVIFKVRYQIYRKKFFIKFLNNFIQQLGPFFFYAIGGYLTIKGSLEIGTLVAAISAHKDLGAPWKELLGFYQRREDARIKYDSVVTQFAPPGMRGPDSQSDEPSGEESFATSLSLANLTLRNDRGDAIINAVSSTVELPTKLAIVGKASSGKEEMAQLLARLIDPDKGAISFDDRDIAGLPESVTGRRLSYVGPQSFIFNATVSDNLFYGLKHRPLVAPDYDDEQAAEQAELVAESEQSGNVTHDVNADWIDYAAAGVAGQAELLGKGLRALKLVGLDSDVYQFGLRGAIDPRRNKALADKILQARGELRQRLEAPDIQGLIETFDREKYNLNATMGENLLFGNVVGEVFDMEQLGANAYVIKVLEEVGLTDKILEIGFAGASTMAEIFADVPPDHELFQQFAFISAEELIEFQALLTRVDRENLAEARPEDRERLMSLPFKLVVSRHRLGLIDDAMQAKILEARAAFSDGLPDDLASSVEFFHADKYNSASNLQDNILFGKVAYGVPRAAERIGELIADVIKSLGLYDTVAEVGMTYAVGIAGSRLSGAQRQKLGIARCLVKRPDILILCEATGALDSTSQATIMENILAEFEGRTVIWVLHRADLARAFDHVLVVDNGAIIEQGAVSGLDRDGTLFRELANEA